MGFLEGQVALVTGGARGLGRGIALALAEEGSSVVILDILDDAGRATAGEIEAKGCRSGFYRVNVADREQVDRCFADIAERFGRLDILVNNAGNTTHPAWCWDMTDADWRSVIDVHVHGTFYCLRAGARLMKARRYGRIVNLSSVAAVHGFVSQINYAAAKFAIIGITLTAAKELGSYGITVNAMQPGVIRSDMTEILLAQGEQKYMQQTPTRKIGEPSDVANGVKFFVNPSSEFVTGVIMRVDGGMALMLGADDDIANFADLYPGKQTG